MRRDMAKKLCERPRVKDGWGKGDRYNRKHGKVNVQSLEIVEDENGNKSLDIGNRESTAKTQGMSIGRGDKVLGENLQPLFRFLESQINRPWDKVYSEIKENVRADSATQLHILQHAEDYVEGWKTKLEEKDGRIYQIAQYGGYVHELRKGDLYIHPRTKLLLKYKKNPQGRLYRKRLRPKEGDVIKINDFTYYCKFEGVWHEIIYNQKWAHENNKWAFPGKFYDHKLVGHPGAFAHANDGNYLEYEKLNVPKSILKKMGLKNAKA